MKDKKALSLFCDFQKDHSIKGTVNLKDLGKDGADSFMLMAEVLLTRSYFTHQLIPFLYLSSVEEESYISHGVFLTITRTDPHKFPLLIMM